MSLSKRIRAQRAKQLDSELAYSTSKTKLNIDEFDNLNVNNNTSISSQQFEDGEIEEVEDEEFIKKDKDDRGISDSNRNKGRDRDSRYNSRSPNSRDDRESRHSRNRRGDKHRRDERRHRSRSHSDSRNIKKSRNEIDDTPLKSSNNQQNVNNSTNAKNSSENQAVLKNKEEVKIEDIDVNFESGSSGERIEKALEERRKRRQALVEQLTVKNPSVQRVISTDINLSSSNNAPSSPATSDYASTPYSPNFETGSSIEMIDLEKHETKPLSTDTQQESSKDLVSAADYNPNDQGVQDNIKRDNQHLIIATTTTINNEIKESAEYLEDEDFDDMFSSKPTKFDTKLPLTQSQSDIPTLSANNLTAVNISNLDNRDDDEGYYMITLGEVLNKRYRISSILGKGVFSSVVNCLDLQTESQVAIKIIRNNPVMYKAGQKEINILKKLRDSDPLGKKHIIKLLNTFEHNKHLCLVFESLNSNLREVLKKFGKKEGINLKAIKIYSQHIFLALSQFKKLELIHADLKPDNILVNSSYNTVKVCDLGSASYENESEITPYLVSRYYRAPEIILGHPYSYPIDIWSIGCTLYELFTGNILFPGHNNNHMLYLIQQLRGKFPIKMIKKGTLSNFHFDENNQFLFNEVDPITQLPTKKIINFGPNPIKDLRSSLGLDEVEKGTEEYTLLGHFLDLLEGTLVLNPEKRLTVKECLSHPFIKFKV